MRKGGGMDSVGPWRAVRRDQKGENINQKGLGDEGAGSGMSTK